DDDDLPPSILGIDPPTLEAGSGPLVVTLTGTGFQPDAVARWNGADRPTTRLSSTQLQVTLSAADLAQPGSGTLTVFNPQAGMTSNAATVVVAPTAPVETLFDSFTRPNSSTVGNGWIEKTDAAFSLVDNRVPKNAVGTGDYRNLLVYRPA